MITQARQLTKESYLATGLRIESYDGEVNNRKVVDQPEKPEEREITLPVPYRVN